MLTAATPELRSLLSRYQAVLPLWSFPYLPLTVAACAQVLAWLSGPILFARMRMAPRIGALWLLAGAEYMFMSPSMNAAVEIMGMSEAMLVVTYQVITIIVFIAMDLLVFKREMRAKHLIAFALLAAAVYVVHVW
jgi:uncharacterized protein (DUF486 family)